MSAGYQRDLFNLDAEKIYINNAYMAPQLKSVSEIGKEHLLKKEKPYHITAADFFTGKEILRSRFAKLIEAEDQRSVAIIPSVSYGIATALKNIPFEQGDEIVVLEEQFPSNYYAWKELEKSKGVKIVTIKAPEIAPGRAKKWNQDILRAINAKTKAVAIPIVHWADGTLFNMADIKTKSNDVNAYLIIDGTQSIGALPFSVAEIQPDALICGGYKWLMGPYSLGVAYFGERFDHGTPIENNWMNHENSEDFSNLVNYNQNFKARAVRYDVGESSNFILTPMLSEGIRQVLEWTPEGIQQYCKMISEKAVAQLKNHGYFIEDEQYRGHHLFGIHFESVQELMTAKEKLNNDGIHLSYRGKSIRVSPHVYCSEQDMLRLTNCLIY